MGRKKPGVSGIYMLLLAAFTIYALLDTFVIPHSYGTVEESQAELPGDVPEAKTDAEADDGALTGDGETEREDSDAQPDSGSAGDTKHGRPGDHRPGGARPDGAKSGTEDSDSSAASDSEQSSLQDHGDSASGQSGQDGVASEAQSLGETKEDGISISLKQYRKYDTDIYVADIRLSSLSDLRTAFAQNTYGRNIKANTSEIAAEHQAFLAINGDYYGAQESGYVIRNGKLYRNTAQKGNEDLAIMSDGTFRIIKEEEVTAEQLLADGAWQVLSFGPALLKEGTVSVTENEEVGKAKASNPRTAVGIYADRADGYHLVFVVSDGRTDASAGLSLYELAVFLKSLGIDTAYNLDGGGSSTMYYDGKVINNPTTNGNIKERSVSDIVYIGA